MHKVSLFVLALCLLIAATPAAARHKQTHIPKILFVPHDNRPISDKQTVDVVRRAGYEVIVPPDSLLGNRDDLGHPDKLWEWVEKNAPEADAAVISADSMLYGSLVGSRKHSYSEANITKRAARFSELRRQEKRLPLYVFGSIMRTPKSGAASGHEEPSYYRSYGSAIFRYTALSDKAAVEGLSRREAKEQAFLKELIPKEALADWLGRRRKNLAANEYMMSLAKNNTFDYFVLGRDDNAPYSQTHLENRHIEEVAAGQNLDKRKFQTMAGIDEVGMLLLTRAVNKLKGDTPSVYVRYNWGRGAGTVPTYSDEPIGTSIAAAIEAAGGESVSSPEGADFVLMVNTNPNGQTGEASDLKNDGTPREGTKYFADIVTEHINKGYTVGIADIAYANGADNALLEIFQNRGVLFKIRAYSGWNTATNSAGFVIGEGMLLKYMTGDDVDLLLLTRYLDDWAYQANVRNTIARQLTWLRGDGVYGSLGSKYQGVQERTTRMMEQFIANRLPSFEELAEMEIVFPWNRLFESDIRHKSATKAPMIKVTDDW